MSDARRNRWTLLVAVMLVAVFLAEGWTFIRANSQTFDEAVGLTAGYSYITTGDFRLNIEHPPFVKLLCALAVFLRYRLPFEPDANNWELAATGEDAAQWRISDAFIHQAPIPAHDLIALGRLPNLILGACLLALVGFWAYRLWGRGAALLTMAVAAFEPTLIAHSCVITTDMAITLFTCLTLYLLWRFVDAPSGRLLTGIGLSLGLVLVSKFSSLLILIIVAACIGAYLLCGGRFALGIKASDAPRPLRARIAEALAPALRIVFIAILVILPFYFFQGFSTWSTGLRTQMNQQSSGMTSYLLGERSASGWWYYFPVAFLIKTPVGTLALLAAALVTMHKGQPLGRREVAFVLLPVLFYVLALTQLKLNIGLRYLLPIYPLLFLSIGHLATLFRRRPWLSLPLLGIPLAASAASSLGNAPHHLAYFNELVGGPAQGHRYLTDSNIDWGQGLIELKQYLDSEKLSHIYLSYYGTARPSAYGIRAQYLPGFGQLGAVPEDPLPEGARDILAISVTSFHALQDTLFRWLNERTPSAVIGHCIWVYDLTGDADAHRHLANMYEQVGSKRLAAIEREKARLSDAKRENVGPLP